MNQVLGLAGALIVLPRGDHSRPIRLPQGVRLPGGTAVVQEYTWLMSEIDPVLGARARAGQPLDLRAFEPEYFLINGLSGVLAVEDPNTTLGGKIGQRTLLRMINAGRAYRSIHMHGNHYGVLTAPDRPWVVGTFLDTLRIPPGSHADVLIPFEAPPDAVPRVTRGQKYVVHDHIEMAETAHGGLYAGGMVSELVFE